MALSVATPKHLKTIGLLSKVEKDRGKTYIISNLYICKLDLPQKKFVYNHRTVVVIISL
jgi:hypothetical protein